VEVVEGKAVRQAKIGYTALNDICQIPRTSSSPSRKDLIAVSDYESSLVILCDPISLKTVTKIETKGRSGVWSWPAGLAIAGDELFIVDCGLNYIHVWNLQTLQRSRIIGKTPIGDPLTISRPNLNLKKKPIQKTRPMSICIHEDEIFSTDVLNLRICVFNRFNGVFLREIYPGIAPGGEFNICEGAAIRQSEDQLFLPDSKAGVVKVIHPMSGKVIQIIGNSGKPEGKPEGKVNPFSSFSYPTGLAVDNDIVYVGDIGKRRISAWGKEGDFFHHWSEKLGSPQAIALVGDELMALVDHQKIQVFQ